MKCQKCKKPATFHITELTGEDVMALHFCGDCAEKYLKPAEEVPETTASPLAEMLSQQLKIGQAADEMTRVNKKTCPVCGVSIYDFRDSGRLGCPHDYVYFQEELEPLLMSIHGQDSIIHKGKKPKSGVANSDQQTELIRLRREMKEAIESEDYEKASLLRDQIKSYED